MSKESYIVSCIRRLREYGEGIVIADQSISSLKDVVKSNVYAIISLSQSSQKDRREISSVMGLTSEQSEVTNILEVGEGLIRLSGRLPYPQFLCFPFAKPSSITEDELDEINGKNKIIRFLLDSVVHNHPTDDKLTASEDSNRNKEKDVTTKIKKNLIRLLVATVQNPYDKSTAILKDAGFSGGSGNKIKTYAINRDYMTEHLIHLGKQGNAGKYFEPTEKAYNFLDEVYVEYKKPKGKGSFEHRLYQDIIFKHFSSKGYSVRIENSIEQNDSYTLVDVSVEKPDRDRISLEIEFNINEHIIHNIEKNIQAKYDEIIIVTKKSQRDKISEFIENNLRPECKDRVQIKPITEFL